MGFTAVTVGRFQIGTEIRAQVPPFDQTSAAHQIFGRTVSGKLNNNTRLNFDVECAETGGVVNNYKLARVKHFALSL